MAGPIRYICGYTKTGKDTITHHLNHRRGSYYWAIYTNPDNRIAFPYGSGYRLSFADQVKREVKAELNLPPSFDIERDKDNVVKDGRTFRSFCIEKGCGERRRDRYHWARLAFKEIDNKGLYGIPTISDWRFYEEIDYGNSFGQPITIRVFRQDVPIPPIVNIDDPEHTLDNYMTDFLLVPHINYHEEFESAKQIFPQYHSYIYHATLAPAILN